MEKTHGPKEGDIDGVYLPLEEMWSILSLLSNTKGQLAGVKSDYFSKGSLNHTACLGEGLHVNLTSLLPGQEAEQGSG